MKIKKKLKKVNKNQIANNKIKINKLINNLMKIKIWFQLRIKTFSQNKKNQ